MQVTYEAILIDDAVYFATNEDIIEPQSFELLNQVAAAIRSAPYILSLRVEGHTDSRGSDTANQDLSQRRAASVVAYLVAQGVEPYRLEAQGYGEAAPIATNETSEGRAQNRRVAFVVARTAVDSRCSGALDVRSVTGSDSAAPINDERGD